MGGRRSILSWLAVAALVLHATGAHAQRTVCAPLGPGERVHSVCAVFSLYPAVRFLADFTVDQLFKPAPPPFQRDLLETAQFFAAREIVEDPALKTFLEALPPVRFSQLDRTTGTLLADFGADRREFEGPLSRVEGEPKLALILPSRLEGGYWRGPDALQVAFWEHHRMAVRLAHENGRAFAAEIECVSLSPDGLLVRFGPATTPPLLMRFRECDQ